MAEIDAGGNVLDRYGGDRRLRRGGGRLRCRPPSRMAEVAIEYVTQRVLVLGDHDPLRAFHAPEHMDLVAGIQFIDAWCQHVRTLTDAGRADDHVGRIDGFEVGRREFGRIAFRHRGRRRRCGLRRGREPRSASVQPLEGLEDLVGFVGQFLDPGGFEHRVENVTVGWTEHVESADHDLPAAVHAQIGHGQAGHAGKDVLLLFEHLEAAEDVGGENLGQGRGRAHLGRLRKRLDRQLDASARLDGGHGTVGRILVDHPSRREMDAIAELRVLIPAGRGRCRDHGGDNHRQPQ